MTFHVRVAGGWTGRLYSMCQEDAERLDRQHSRHRILQQQLSNKLNPFQSIPIPLERSTTSVGQDNLAYAQEPTSLPVTNNETAISTIASSDTNRAIQENVSCSSLQVKKNNNRNLFFLNQ